MKTWQKVLGGVLILILVLVVVLVALASTLITPERVRETVLPLAEKHLHRKLELGDIKVSLFKGIELRGLTLYDRDGREPFVATDLVRLRYQLLPLLSMRVVIDEVRLERPQIRVVRLKDGSFNFSDLASPGKATEPGAASGAGDSSSGVPIRLLVSEVYVQDGALHFLDHVLNDAAPYRHELHGLQVAARGVTLDAEVPVSIQGQLNGSRIALDGRVRLLPLGGEFDLEASGLDVTSFGPYFKDAVPGKLRGLKLGIKASLSGNAEVAEVDGLMTADGLDLLLDALPDTPLTGKLTVDHKLSVDLKQERLAIDRIALDFNGLQANLSGSVAALRARPVVDLAVSVPKLDVRQVLQAVPQSLVADVKTLDPSGTVDLEARLQGAIEKPVALLKSASIALHNLQTTAGEQRPSIDGRLKISGAQLVSEDLHVRLGENRADIALKVADLFATPKVVTADVRSERFLLDPLFKGGASATAAGDPAAARQAARGDGEIGPFDIPVTAGGTVTLGETLWKGVSVKDFVVQYELRNNVFTLKRMDGQVAGGSFSNTARVDLGQKGLAYTAKLGLKAIQADPLLAALAPGAAGSLFGAMDLNLALEGRGTEWQTLSRRLNGAGDMQVADGRLVSPGLVGGLSSFLEMPELQDIRFSNFQNSFKIIDGKVAIDGRILSSTLKLFPKGKVGLDGSLDLALDTRLSPEMSARLDRKAKVSGYLRDADGWSRLPLLVTGTVDAPRFGLDPKGVQEQATRAIGEEIGRRLFGGGKSAPAGDGQQPAGGTTPTEDPAKQLLKKLFGN